MNNICPHCGETVGQKCHCPEANLFLTHHDQEDFAEAVCGCLLERRGDGEGANFLMCPMHTAAPELLELFKRGLECGIFDDAPVYKKDVKAMIAKAEKGADNER